MEFRNLLYETLSPLSTTASPAPESSGKHVVLRNQIHVITNSTPLPETSAPEFVSLDCRTPMPPIKRSRLSNPLPDEGPEKSIQAGSFRAGCRFKSPMLQLHKEILDFCDFLSPTAEEQVSRNTAVESVTGVIKYIWPNCKVEVFGSFKTGLFLPTSDVDMVVLGSHIHYRTPQTGLRALSKALSQRDVAIKIQVLGRARVPIIKFMEKKSGISFDISLEMDNGPKAAEYIQDAISKWPPLRPLCLILKVFLKQRKLNEVHTGGIGSYALLTMLIAMLQNSRDNSPDIHSFAQYNLGRLLVTFFDMYGNKLNTSDVGISCNEGSTFFSKRSKGFLTPGRRLLISIQDPQAPHKDIGKNSYKYLKIKSSFRMACSTLTNTQLIMSLGPNRSILGTIIRPDKALLGRNGGLNGDMTFTNLLPGAGEQFLDDFGQHKGLFGKQHLEGDEEALPDAGGEEALPDAGGEEALPDAGGDEALPDDDEALPPCGKDIVSDDGVAKKCGEKSKNVVKVKKIVKVKKMKKVIVIEEKKKTPTDAADG